jgi:hypothetical protein
MLSASDPATDPLFVEEELFMTTGCKGFTEERMRVFSPACIAAVACCLSNCSILPRSISGRVRSEDLITASGENDLSVTGL